MPLSGQICWSGTNGQVRGGGFRTCPGWRTAGSSPIVVLLAAYHLGHSRAISRSLANGPDLLAAMDHRVSPGMTTTPSSSEARGVATRAEDRLSKPGSMIGALGFHPGVTFRPVFVQAASGDCAVDVLLHPGSGTEAAKAAVPPRRFTLRTAAPMRIMKAGVALEATRAAVLCPVRFKTFAMRPRTVGAGRIVSHFVG